MSKLIYTGSEWDENTIARAHEETYKIATEELGLDLYDSSYEIITSDQMLDLYTSIAMPLNYNHWSFGKHFLQEESSYRRGHSGLAYEITSNTNPNIVYLMEENTATIQTLVIAHCLGHNAFFKNNYLFKTWTDASSIVDYLNFARKYIKSCEEKHGVDEVEKILDSAHALKNHGVDRYKRPVKISSLAEISISDREQEQVQKYIDLMWKRILDTAKKDEEKDKRKLFPPEPQENILKFLEKHSPILKPWQREILRIVRTIAQYFDPQRSTKVGNEGFACWTHYYIMNRLHEKGLIDDGAMIEFFKTHSNVVMQPEYDSKFYSGINPYALGLELFFDIERICKNPTKEDKEWFPELIGENYIEVIKDAVANYRDESLIRQYMSPRLIRKMKLFRLQDHDDDFYEITSIHNEQGYKNIINSLASDYEISKIIPDIQVYNSNMDTNRHLELRHYSVNGKLLDAKSSLEVLKHIKRLWGFEPYIGTYDIDGNLIDELFIIDKIL